MRTYPLEQQYLIYRYGMDVIHPPLMDLADPIAEKGVVAIPFIRGKLQDDPGDLAVRDILLILDRMISLKSYDVASDTALIDNLQKRVDGMKDTGWRLISVKSLNRIKSLARP